MLYMDSVFLWQYFSSTVIQHDTIGPKKRHEPKKYTTVCDEVQAHQGRCNE